MVLGEVMAIGKVRLKIVSKYPEVQRAEHKVLQHELEVAAAQQELADALERLKQSRERAESIRSKTKTATKKPKVQRVDSVAQLVYNSRVFGENPTKRIAKASSEIAQKHGKWDPLALLGLYLDQYATRYRRDWRGTTHGLITLHREMKKLFDRVGDEAELAIIAVFSPKLKWADNQMGLLLSIDAYERYIVPAIDAVRKDRRGEGSEWTGSRDEVGGCEEVDL